MPDMNLGAFIAHLAAFNARLAHAEHQALTHAARVIQAEAKHEIGTYQGPAGPFAGWAELAKSTKAERLALGFEANQPGLRTGEMRDSIEFAVGHREAVVGSNDDHLVAFELGTKNQPPRSVLGTAAVHKAPEVARILGGSVVTALVGRDVFGGRMPIP